MEDIVFIKLENNKNLKIILSNKGASIYAIYYDKDIMNVTPNNYDDFLKNNLYYGKTIGRLCGRIKNGISDVNNHRIQLDCNENNNMLHGGRDGLSTKVFSYSISETKISYCIDMNYISPHLESGFPGTMNIHVIYVLLKNKNELQIKLSATSDMVSVINLSNHTYFCLNEDNIDKLKLKISSSKFIEMDPVDLVPEKIKSVSSVMDFRKMKAVNKDINNSYLCDSATKGYDHFYIFDNTDISKPNIVLKSPKYKLSIYSNCEGAQIYSDNYSDCIKMINSNSSSRRGIAIEPQRNGFFNCKIRKNELFSEEIRYVFKKEKK